VSYQPHSYFVKLEGNAWVLVLCINGQSVGTMVMNHPGGKEMLHLLGKYFVSAPPIHKSS
jgi:hypothetical protein